MYLVGLGLGQTLKRQRTRYLEKGREIDHPHCTGRQGMGKCGDGRRTRDFWGGGGLYTVCVRGGRVGSNYVLFPFIFIFRFSRGDFSKGRERNRGAERGAVAWITWMGVLAVEGTQFK